MLPVVWRAWKLCYIIYIVPMLFVRYRFPLFTIFKMVIMVNRESRSLNNVDKNTFDKCMGIIS